MPLEWDDAACRTEELTAAERFFEGSANTVRLDGLLPSDPQTQAVTESALKVYLQAMMEMALRCNQPLSLVCMAVDDSAMLQRFRREDMGLVARAIMRCMKQETRAYDVIGRTDATDTHGLPAFLLVCPLMTESQSLALAERMRAAMTAYAIEADQEWLTLSIGLAGLTVDIQDAEEMIARALSALQRAQRRGGSIMRHSDMIRRIQETSEGYADGAPQE